MIVGIAYGQVCHSNVILFNLHTEMTTGHTAEIQNHIIAITGCAAQHNAIINDLNKALHVVYTGRNHNRCIGCRFCTVACPYQIRYFNWYVPEWPEALKEHLNPDPEVAPRPKGVVEKCTFCIQRLRKAREEAEAEGRPFEATDYIPACVQTCTGHARYFGDLDDPDSLVSQLAASPRAFRLLEEMGTEPKVYYLKQG